jgi:hypothetical protein
MKIDPTKNLAEKIARLIESESQAPDHAALFAAIEKINHRLDKIESGQQRPKVTPDLISEISSLRSHPSLDKFDVAEAIADAVFGGVQGMHREKACQFEPGKPCDHCSMCNSRGF